MPTATMTSKGRITIPGEVRQAMGLRVGTQVEFVPAGDGFRLVARRTQVPALRGRFAGRTREPVSIEAMDPAVAPAKVAAVRKNKPQMRQL